MKIIFYLSHLLVFCNYLHTQAQSKYFSSSIQWNDFYVQEFRKAIPVNNSYTVLVANTYPDFPGYWQNAITHLNNQGICSPIISFVNPEVGDLGNFDALSDGEKIILVGLFTPAWDTSASQAYIQWININDNTTDIIPLIEYPSSIRTIHKCTDGGYLLAGRVIPNYPNTPQWLEMYAVKLNSQFDVEWERIYDDLGYYYDNYLTDILPAPDGSGYYLLGTIKWGGSMFESGDMLLMKINNVGEPVEQYPININGMDYSLNFTPTPDGNLLISGGVRGETGLSKAVVLKCDWQGNVLWENQLFDTGVHEGYIQPILVSPDGNYIGAGAHKTPGSIKKNDVFLAKFSAESGNILWQRHYGGNYYDYCYDMIATPDGGYLMVGRQDTLAGAFAYIVKTNCMGLLTEPQAAFTFTTDSTTLAATFYNQSQQVYPDSIDGGHFIWNFDDGTPPYQTKEPIPITHLYTQPGTYYVTLQAIVCNDTSTYTTIVKPQSGWGTAVGIQTAQNSPPVEGLGVVVYPNPAQNTLTFQRVSKSPLGDLGVRLLSLTGQTVLQTTLAAGGASQTVSVANLPAGVYFYTVSVAGGDTGNGDMGGAVLARGKVAVVR